MYLLESGKEFAFTTKNGKYYESKITDIIRDKRLRMNNRTFRIQKVKHEFFLEMPEEPYSIESEIIEAIFGRKQI